VVSAALSECSKDSATKPDLHGPAVDPRVVREPAVERLVQAFVAFDGVERDLVALHVEALCLAILTRLLSMRGNSDLPATGRRMAPLPKWRLKRVVDYVNAHLASRITLADLAVLQAGPECTAAQFRVATGTRPHDCPAPRPGARGNAADRSLARSIIAPVDSRPRLTHDGL
jgi:hypothetical protein